MLAEDSVLLREGLAGLLARFGHEVAASVGDAEALVRAVEGLTAAGGPPDVVVTDVRMPPGHADDGLVAAVELRRRHPGLGILVLSQYIADAYAAELIERTSGPGGVGYLLKDRIGRLTEFAAALDAVAGGGVVIDPEVVRHLLTRRAPGGGPLDRLTPRERQVLALMAEGRANAEIAEHLVVTEHAVAKHIGNIFAKLDLSPAEGHRRVRAVLAYLRLRS
ncbi:DNA-binding NarL/FixJ family response regulator [Thermocatellispora tengchongensis]|uniref:DNA-binding NarL/FixJ family response regulator n=1 Tax=Thermocatellispora tengchongensis TaxID=1073253 RepID=A0A840PCF9_9ACTN|nr:DNA-binding NarL/FixJ family response regulator [Thermocatellispora tengchongensis]